MPTTFTLNPGSSTSFSNPVHKIEVFTGTLTVHQGDTPATVKAGEVYDGGNRAPHVAYSPDGAGYAVTFSDEALPTETVASVPVTGAVNAKKPRKRSTSKK
jgi:hypothetical protein